MMGSNPNIIFHNFQGWRSENWRKIRQEHVRESETGENLPSLAIYLYISHPVFWRVPIYFRSRKLHPILYPPSLFPCFISSSDPFPPQVLPPSHPRPPPLKGRWGVRRDCRYRCRFSVFIFCPG